MDCHPVYFLRGISLCSNFSIYAQISGFMLKFGVLCSNYEFYAQISK